MTSEAESTSQTTSFARQQVLSDAGERLFELEIPHDWRFKAESTFSRACVHIMPTLEPDGRQVVVKLGPSVNEHEYRALQFVWSASGKSGRSPEPIAFFTLPETRLPVTAPPRPQARRPARGPPRGLKLPACHVIVMSRIPGVRLCDPLRRDMDKTTRNGLLRDAVAWMEWLNDSLRQQGIYPPVPGCFSDIDGRRCLNLPLLDTFVDHPIPETVASDGSVPLPNFRDADGQTLNHLRDQVLACITRQDAEQPPRRVAAYGRSFSPTGPQPIRFCHMDLHAGNIMIAPVAEEPGSADHGRQGRTRWRFSGLVDWAYAGWYTARLEAYAGIFHPWADYGDTRPIKIKGSSPLTYVEYEARLWSADVDLAEAAGSARLSLHHYQLRETNAKRRFV